VYPTNTGIDVGTGATEGGRVDISWIYTPGVFGNSAILFEI
jgi:hypothetical protein